MDNDADKNVYDIYYQILSESGRTFKDPEIMVYMIVETVSGSTYSPILYSQPAPIEDMKPYIFESVRTIIKQHTQGD